MQKNRKHFISTMFYLQNIINVINKIEKIYLKKRIMKFDNFKFCRIIERNTLEIQFS